MDVAWEWSCLSSSPEETFEIGRALGSALAPEGPPAETLERGATLALTGELGSGKTLFTKGLAAGVGVRDADRVTSPTFVLRQDYQGRLRIHHYDVYRLSGAKELLAIGFEEDLDSGAVVVVEWADRVLELIPPEALHVAIEHEPALPGVSGTSPADPCRRRIAFRGPPDPWAGLVRRALER